MVATVSRSGCQVKEDCETVAQEVQDCVQGHLALLGNKT